MIVVFRKVRTPRKAHPLVKLLVDKMNEQGIGVVEMCNEAGVTRNSFGNWGRTTSPNITSLEACFNVLGYTLAIAPLPNGGQYRPINKINQYVVTSPKGVEFQALGLGRFCTEHGLNVDGMYAVSRGKSRSWKGWTVRKKHGMDK